ncbi:MAG TPA: hypothetical protein VJZ26_10585 [Blastocatellia bacterium]|nr:hypothetical protein [Blastocatellia bacterium]
MNKTSGTEINAHQAKRPYARPELMRVQLRPEEAVLGACKAIGGTIGGGAGGTCSVVSCQATGS